MTSPSTAVSARASLSFSCLGHLFAHVFEPIFFVAALVLPAELGMPYEQVLALIIAAKLLYGLLAPAAGWLGDRWSTVGMMAVYFVGLGAAAVAVGLADGAFQIALALAVTGLFGSIYHPVGIAWLLRNATDKGQAIGINGVFGGIGPAVAALLAGALIETVGWRSAFVVPGIAVLATGAAFLWFLARGWVVETKADRVPHVAPSRGEAMRAGLVLSITMLCAGLIYQSTQPALPKVFAERLAEGSAVADAAWAVSAVYLIAGLTQVVAGRMADRVAPKRIYQLAYVAQVPLLLALAWGTGWSMVGIAMAAVAFNMAGIPAENLLLARYTPAKWRGTAFGLKFVLGFGIAGLGVPLVSLLKGLTGDFTALFVLLAGCAGAVAVAANWLPEEEKAAKA